VPAKKRKIKSKAPEKAIKKEILSSKSIWQNKRLLALLIFGFSFLLYANTLGHKYAVDDAIVIYDNMFTTKGIEGIPGILTKDTFFGFFKDENKAKLVSGGRYRPMTLVLFALERQIFGDSPFIGHLMNIIYYGLVGILIFLLFRMILYHRFNIEEATIISFFCALLFIEHPIHTEAVANIKGRDEILCLLASLGAVYLVFKYIKGHSTKVLTLIFLSFFVGLMSKENAITYLAIAPLIFIYFYKDKPKSTLMKGWLSMIVAAVVFLAIRSSILGFDFGGSPPGELMNNPYLKLSGGSYIPFTGGEKMATVLFTLGKYIQLLIVPHPLIHDYYPREIDIMNFKDWSVLLSVAVYIGLLLIAIVGYRKRTIVSFGILYFLITLSIVSNIVFPVGTNMSERFLFMPSIGFTLILASLAFTFLKGKKNLFFAVMGIVLLAFSLKTISRNTVWKDDFTLFTNDVKISDKSAKLLNAAGGAMVTKASELNDGIEKTNMLNQAKTYLNKSLQVHPTYKNAYLLLGNANFFLKDFESAINVYEEVLRLYPGYSEARENLGITYRDAGRYYGEVAGDLNKAIGFLTKAYTLRPKEYETVRLLGVAMGLSENSKEAIRYFTELTFIAPNSADAFVNLGNAYMNYGDEENGRINYQKAIEIDPDALKSNK
jgi:tetratricopeptide (TPR) repeat protein